MHSYLDSFEHTETNKNAKSGTIRVLKEKGLRKIATHLPRVREERREGKCPLLAPLVLLLVVLMLPNTFDVSTELLRDRDGQTRAIYLKSVNTH